MFGLVGAVHGNPEIRGLGLRQLRQLHADFFEVQAGHFFVEFLRQAIDADFVSIFVFPKIELREHLV